MPVLGVYAASVALLTVEVMRQDFESTSIPLTQWVGDSFEHAVPDASVSDPLFIAAAGRANRLLPSAVHDALCDFADTPSRSGAVLIRGVPVGQLPPTPPSPITPCDKNHWTEFVLLSAARRLGHPVGYLPEHSGDVVQNIVPTRSAADRQVSTSSKVRLEFHTEAAFHPHRPRYLLLFCLRGDPLAATTLCSVRDVLDHLDIGVENVLREPRFATGVDESYLGHRSDALGAPMSVISGPRGTERFCFDGDLMRGLDPEAVQALEELRRSVDATQRSVILEQGDLLIVDNSISVHGRSPFTPRFDGTDRWLQRTFVVSDLAPSANDRVGRVIATSFDN